MNPNMPPRKDPANTLLYLGIALLLFGAIMPSMLFPDENQFLVGFIGAPFVLIGLILMLAGSFPTRRLDDKDTKKKGREDGP